MSDETESVSTTFTNTKSINDSNTIIQHTEVPTLNLAIGRIPDIYSARDRPPKKILPPPTQEAQINPRFAPIRMNGEPVLPEASKSARSLQLNYGMKSPRHLQIERDVEYAKKVQEKLDAYDVCARNKAFVHEQDYEEHYYIPLTSRIKEQMEIDKYQKFLKQKEEANEKMDKDPVPINSNREPGHIETIHYSKKGLSDPTVKYREKHREEKKLMDFLAKSNGEYHPKPSLPPLNRLDYKMYTVQASTRFFFGTEPGHRGGRHAFPGVQQATIRNVIDTFPEPAV